MNISKLPPIIISLILLMTGMLSCTSWDDDIENLEGYEFDLLLVTIVPVNQDRFVIVPDSDGIIMPININVNPFGKQEIRAIASCAYAGFYNDNPDIKTSKIAFIDSITTLQPIESMPEIDNNAYGTDPLEVMLDWTTVCEDGYLNLSVKSVWGLYGNPSRLKLIYGTNPDDPLEFQLRYDGNGLSNGSEAVNRVAFNLNKYFESIGLTNENVAGKRLKVKFNSFSGPKIIEFPIAIRSQKVKDLIQTI